MLTEWACFVEFLGWCPVIIPIKCRKTSEFDLPKQDHWAMIARLCFSLFFRLTSDFCEAVAKPLYLTITYCSIAYLLYLSSFNTFSIFKGICLNLEFVKKNWILPRYLAKVRDWVGTWALEEIQHHPCSQGILSSTRWRCIFGIPTISHEIPTHHDIKSGIRGIYMRFVLDICWPRMT